MRNVRRLVALVVLGAAVAGLAACGSSSDKKSTATAAAGGAKPFRIAYFASNLNGWVQADVDGVKQGAPNADVTVFNANFDPSKQISQIVDATTSKRFDAFVVYPASPAVDPQVKSAIGAGIKVASVLLPIAQPSGNAALPGEVISTNQRYEQRGEALGDLTIQACKGKPSCAVAFLIGVKGLPVEQVVYNAFKQKIAGAPNVKLVATAEGKYDPEASRQATQNILQSNPNLAVVVGGADLMTQGAELAAKSAGKQLTLIGLGASSQACKAVADGSWFGTVTTLPRTEGELAGKALAAAVASAKAPTGLAPDPIALSTFGPAVTKANAADCKPEWTQ